MRPCLTDISPKVTLPSWFTFKTPTLGRPRSVPHCFRNLPSALPPRHLSLDAPTPGTPRPASRIHPPPGTRPYAQLPELPS